VSSLCRTCGNQMPKERKGQDQYCPNCLRTANEKKIREAVEEHLRKVKEACTDDRRTDIKEV